MENERVLQTLVDKLIEKTEQGRIKWTYQDADDPFSDSTVSYFTLSLTRGTLSIWSVDGDDLHPFVFEIRGDRGQVVERVETPRININEDRDYSPFDDSVKKLYRLARRDALNIDSVLRQMLEDLDGK